VNGVDRRVLRVARAAARDAVRDGARAVVLTGSRVRGDSHPDSDIDLIVVLDAAPSGRKWPRAIERRGGYLVTSMWETPSTARAAFREPRLVGAFVPGWRDGVILHDPDGVAARLQSRARAWSWAEIDAGCNRWVAEEITGYTEEVHKLAGGMELNRTHASAVWRSVLATRLATILAVHHRILYGSENVLWDAVGQRMGARWRRDQAAALSEGAESLAGSCAAALRLYALAAREVWDLLDRRQRAVVTQACAVARQPLRPDRRRARTG
jgi:hypothetical protein